MVMLAFGFMMPTVRSSKKDRVYMVGLNAARDTLCLYRMGSTVVLRRFLRTSWRGRSNSMRSLILAVNCASCLQQSRRRTPDAHQRRDAGGARTPAFRE